MPSLSWNEIRQRAIAFSHEWKRTTEERAEPQTLEKEGTHAFQYIQELQSEGRAHEIPRYIVVSDFQRIVLHDLEPKEGDPPILEFPLEQFHRHVKHFSFLIGQKTHKFGEEAPYNLEAAAIMADLGFIEM